MIAAALELEAVSLKNEIWELLNMGLSWKLLLQWFGELVEFVEVDLLSDRTFVQ